MNVETYTALVFGVCLMPAMFAVSLRQSTVELDNLFEPTWLTDS
jgi:hypothetical protein